MTKNEKMLFNIGAWLEDGAIGASAKSMVAIALGHTCKRVSYPMDSSDFARCAALIEVVPEISDHMPQIASAHPVWKALVAEWSDLFGLLHEDKRELSERISSIRVKHSKERTVGGFTVI